MITYKELIEAANQLEETAANLPLVRDPNDDQ